MQAGTALYLFFYCFIGKFVEFSYKAIKPSGQERTAAEWNHVAEATRRRRRILQSRILFYVRENENENAKGRMKTWEFGNYLYWR